jgi:hypothetical protein
MDLFDNIVEMVAIFIHLGLKMPKMNVLAIFMVK